MSSNYIIMILIWLIGITGFVFTPNYLKRKLIFASITFQALSWLESLIYVNLNLIAFPVREFPRAVDILFTTEFFLYPLLCGFYVIYQPEKSLFIRVLHLLSYVSIVTVIDSILAYFSELVVYVHFTWYWKWITLLILFSITNTVYKWFLKKDLVFEGEKRVLR